MRILRRLVESDSTLTDREAFLIGFQQARRDIPLWLGVAAGAAFLPSLLGVAGKIITGMVALLFVVLAVLALSNVVRGLIALATWAFLGKESTLALAPWWAVLSTGLMAVEAALYLACLYFLSKVSDWWGLPQTS